MIAHMIFKLLGVCLLTASAAWGQSEVLEGKEAVVSSDLKEKLTKIDASMEKAVDLLQIPGIALGIVVDGKVVLTKGYGVRSQSGGALVTQDTLFAIGSCSKAFTACALGKLVDEGLIGWDDPVVKYIPEFRLHDPHATYHLTIRDLITHRSGLPRHDLMWYNSEHSRRELLQRLQYLEPTADLREKFQYNNLMYMVAGLVIEQVTNQTWEEFVQQRICSPIGMDLSNFSVTDSQKTSDFAVPHTEKEDCIVEIPFRNISSMGPAGSINSSASDMVKWIQMQLCNPNELVRKETLAEMHRVQMAMNSPFDAVFGEDLNLFGYGLGWMVGLYKNHYTVNHGGGIDGFISSVVLFPKEKMGIVILTNTDSRGVFPMAAAYGIADCLMGEEKGDWLLEINEKQAQFKKILKPEKEDSSKKGSSEIRPLDAYLGEFEHPGYGIIDITLGETGLIASYNKISYTLEHRCYDHFIGKMQSNPFGHKLDALFMSDALGEVSQFHISLEPTLPPIVFKKRAQEAFLKAAYLKQFEGDFEGDFFSINISLKKDRLMATVEGQPSCEMHPEKEGLFSLKEVPGCFLRFASQEGGASFKLSLEQAGQTFSLAKRS